MNTETQKLQDEINSMGLVDLLDTELKLKQNFNEEDCSALRMLVRKKINVLENAAFSLLSKSQDHTSQQTNA